MQEQAQEQPRSGYRWNLLNFSNVSRRRAFLTRSIVLFFSYLRELLLSYTLG